MFKTNVWIDFVDAMMLRMRLPAGCAGLKDSMKARKQLFFKCWRPALSFPGLLDQIFLWRLGILAQTMASNHSTHLNKMDQSDRYHIGLQIPSHFYVTSNHLWNSKTLISLGRKPGSHPNCCRWWPSTTTSPLAQQTYRKQNKQCLSSCLPCPQSIHI